MNVEPLNRLDSDSIVGELASASPQTGQACANCGMRPVGHYCANCGQRVITDHDLTVARFVHDTVHEFTSVDGRLWATLWVLLTRPGLLAREYFAGRGSRYMKPLSLFVLLNLVFFLIQPHTGLLRYNLDNYIGFDGDVAARRADAVNVTRIDRAIRQADKRAVRNHPAPVPVVEPLTEFRIRFDDVLQDLMKSMLIVSIPLLAVGMWVLYLGSGRRFAEHLVFTVHVYAYFLFVNGVVTTPLFTAVFAILRALGVSPRATSVLSTEGALVAFMFVTIASYIYFGLRRMYDSGRLVSLLRATVLFGVMQLLIIVYHDVLFYATLASL